jgi:addiction module HigA family antidote
VARTIAKGKPVHPGDILKHEFLADFGLSAYALAKAIGVPTNRVTGIINRQRGITADTALRLGRFFGTTAEFWMNLQYNYDLRAASTPAALKRIAKIPTVQELMPN